MSVTSESIPTFNGSFDDFFAYLSDDGARPTISPQKYVVLLGMDFQSLAADARVHRNTISRAPGSEAVQKYLRDALAVIRAATDTSGTVEKALYWFRNNPLPTFNYKTPQQIVSGGGAENLIRYLQSLKAGFAG